MGKIYTLTLNPSLDYIVTVKNFGLGRTNRTDTEQLYPGGKGLNVSTMLARLGQESVALGFLAGFVGEEISRRAEGLGFAQDFLRLGEGVSRINVKLRNFEGTEINGKGPRVRKEDLEQLYGRLGKLQSGDLLVLAGSLPEGVPDTLYLEIMDRLKDKGIAFVVDAAGSLLRKALGRHPFLVKPNRQELGDLFETEIKSRKEVPSYARRLQEEGARNVLVSLAGEGAVLLDELGKVHELPAPKGELVNAVGAGDSMVAGFLAGWFETRDYEHAFRMGLAAGSASAFSEFFATGKEVRKLYERLGQV